MKPKNCTHFCSKATELLRLIELKNFGNVLQTAKSIFCLESASMLCGTAFDYPIEAIKYSGLNKKEYFRHKNTFDTLLGLKRQLQLKDICLQLDLPQSIQTKAQHLLNSYQMSEKFTDNIQSAHCLTMAVYQCCKQQKIKSVKNKLSALSGVDNSTWKHLEEQWDKWIVSAEPFKEKMVPIHSDDSVRKVDDEEIQPDSTRSTGKTGEDKTQSYEEWKAAMIAKAMAALNKQNNTSQNEITIE